MTQHPLDGILDILKETMEGGDPEAGTAFVENTRADGVRHGLLPTLERLSAEQASRDLHGASIAGHARHSAFHLEVLVRWEQGGERGPFDWKGSFLPMNVDAAEWETVQQRLRVAYSEVLAYGNTLREQPLNDDIAAAFAAATAHVAYHLGSVRQMVKALEK